jgi:hypothetical protein
LELSNDEKLLDAPVFYAIEKRGNAGWNRINWKTT